MDGESVKNLERIISQSVFIEADGRKYGRNERGEIKPILYEPRPGVMNLQTLTGLVDYIKSGIDFDASGAGKLLIVVKSPDKAALISAIGGADRGRDILVSVSLDEELKSYRFGQYQEVEEFIIGLNSLFEESPDREKLIEYVSRVKGGESLSLDDDGVTQIATVSRGVSGALTERESAPKIVNLKPYRTFRDIEQPSSDFLFRMKLLPKDKESVVGVCLYEADGGRWRNTAVQDIKQFLQDELKELKVTITA